MTVYNEGMYPGEFLVAETNNSISLDVGNLAAGQRYAVWIRRVVDAGTAAVADSFTLRVKGDTAA
jgi:hypothetical protein